MPWTKIAGPAYWTLFVVMFLVLAVWESLRPKRPLSFSAERRWGRHAMLLAVSSAAQNGFVANQPRGSRRRSGEQSIWTLESPLAAVHSAMRRSNVGARPHSLLTHRIFHSVPLLWRVHEVHHSDPDYDVSNS